MYIKYLKSKKFSLITLGVLSFLCSRLSFSFVNDPEGPNLLIVTVLAVIIYFLSLTAYLLKISSLKKFLYAILIQIVIVTVLYFCFS